MMMTPTARLLWPAKVYNARRDDAQTRLARIVAALLTTPFSRVFSALFPPVFFRVCFCIFAPAKFRQGWQFATLSSRRAGA
ncbi:hypothetical protein LF95_12115 [Thalassospira sp. TSL5-1]|nr:hypothetical protein LF95_12115 [Thalassospira sp. TSL5-1]